MRDTALPELRLFTNPDGTPDWAAANRYTRDLILRILHEEPGISGAELERRCREDGIAPRVTHFSRRDLEREGLIWRREVRRDYGRRRNVRTHLWSLTDLGHAALLARAP